MSAVASAQSDADSSDRQRDVVGDHQQILAGDMFRLEPVIHSLTAEVHEGGRLYQNDLPAADLDPCYMSEPLGRKRRACSMTGSISVHGYGTDSECRSCLFSMIVGVESLVPKTRSGTLILVIVTSSET